MDHLAALRALLGERPFALLAVAGLPDADGVHGAVSLDVASVVQDEAVGLPRFGREPEAPSHHLHVEPRRLRRAQQHHAVDVGDVEAGGAHRDVAEPAHRLLPLAEQVGMELSPEAAEDRRALLRGRFAREDGRFVARELVQLLRDVQRVLHRGAEHDDRLPSGGQVHGVAAGSVDGVGVVHGGLHLFLDEFARAHAKAVEPDGGMPRLARERGQVALSDKGPDLGAVADAVEQVLRLADRAAVQAERRRRVPDEAHERIQPLHRLEEAAVAAFAVRGDQMGLVHDQQVAPAEEFRLVVDALDAADDDRLLRVPAAESGAVDADRDAGAELRDLVGVLLQQLADVRKDHHAAVPVLHGVRRDLRDAARLAAGRGDLHAGVVVRLAQRLVDGFHAFPLVGPQRQHGYAPGPAPASTSPCLSRFFASCISANESPAIRRTLSSGSPRQNRNATFRSAGSRARVRR